MTNVPVTMTNHCSLQTQLHRPYCHLLPSLLALYYEPRPETAIDQVHQTVNFVKDERTRPTTHHCVPYSFCTVEPFGELDPLS